MTTQNSEVLDLAVDAVVAYFASSYLDAASAALQRTKDRRDTEALHDFRVAVRRLRCALRAYRPWLGSAAGRRVRRVLKELGDKTNAGRDAEVQVEWLEARRESLTRGQRTGLNWFLARRRAVKRKAYEAARRAGREDFDRIATRISKRLPSKRDENAGAARDSSGPTSRPCHRARSPSRRHRERRG